MAPQTRSSPSKNKLSKTRSSLSESKRPSPKKKRTLLVGTTVNHVPEEPQITITKNKRSKRQCGQSKKKARVELEEHIPQQPKVDDKVANKSSSNSQEENDSSHSNDQLNKAKKMQTDRGPTYMKDAGVPNKAKKKARVEIEEHIPHQPQVDDNIAYQSPSNSEEKNDSSHSNDDELDKEKKNQAVRGPTHLKGACDPNKAKEVEWNSKGQPIGPASVEMASELGVLVRTTISVNEDNWTYVQPSIKEDIFTVLKQKYKLDDDCKDFIFGKMGCMLRQHRCNIASKVNKAMKIEDEDTRKKKLASEKPICMTDREWEQFIARVTSTSYKAKGASMSELRRSYTEPHGISRLGYARFEDNLKKERNTNKNIPREELWLLSRKKSTEENGKGKNTNSIVSQKLMLEMQNNGQSSSTSLKKDPLAKARGEDRPGRVTGLGYGVTRSKLKAQAQSTKFISSLFAKIADVESKVDILYEGRNRKTDCGPCNDQPQVATPQSKFDSNAHSDVGVNKPVEDQPCKLLSWQGEIVAEGRVAFVGADRNVHCTPLGNDACAVWVDNPVVPEAHLWKPTSFLKTVGEAEGTTVAWHISFLSFDG